jgi:hypothetical protein
MRPDDGGIDNQIFEVRVIGHRLEYPPPNTLGAPSAEAPEYAVPVPERQGEPVRTIQSTPSMNIRLFRPVEPF